MGRDITAKQAVIRARRIWGSGNVNARTEDYVVQYRKGGPYYGRDECIIRCKRAGLFIELKEETFKACLDKLLEADMSRERARKGGE